jgi:hypothetical protein
MNELRLSGVNVEWLLPGKNHQDISTINQKQTLPIKFSIRDRGSNEFVSDLLEDMTVIVNKKGEDSIVSYIGTIYWESLNDNEDSVTNHVYSSAVTEEVYVRDSGMEESFVEVPNYGNSEYIRVDFDDEHYIVNFHARSYSISSGIYEVRVVYKGRQIGRTEYFKVD